MGYNKPSPVLSSTIIFFLFIGLNIYSQPNKRTNYWYFSINVGLDFNSGDPVEDSAGMVFSRHKNKKLQGLFQVL